MHIYCTLSFKSISLMIWQYKTVLNSLEPVCSLMYGTLSSSFFNIFLPKTTLVSTFYSSLNIIFYEEISAFIELTILFKFSTELQPSILKNLFTLAIVCLEIVESLVEAISIFLLINWQN